jgi:hypothetical protein
VNSHGVVYRAYGADGALLYVGCTTRPLKRRLGQHAKNSAWWPLHDRIEHDTPLPVAMALRSESDQITLLRPRFNQNAGGGRIGAAPTTEREVLEWKARYEAGETLEEIALDAGICTTTARKHLVAAGTEMRRAGARVGVPRGNLSNPRAKPTGPVVRVAFVGARGVHRRRGWKRAA